MASTSSASKDIFIDPISHSTPASTAWSYFNPLSPLSNAYDRVQQWRADLGLPNPGTTENLQKEVRGMWGTTSTLEPVLTDAFTQRRRLRTSCLMAAVPT